jgi:hypothetical protein
MNKTEELKKLTQNIKKICLLAKKHKESGGAWSTGSIEARYILSGLTVTANRLSILMSGSVQKLPAWKISTGAGKLPKVLWISFPIGGTSPGNSPSVSVCFGKNGDGIVAGLMTSRFNPSLRLTTKIRDCKEGTIDVDGSSAQTKFNNAFVNPIEYSVENLDSADLISHLVKSFKIADKSPSNRLQLLNQ